MPNYRHLARVYARRHGIDPNIFERQISAESGFNPNARSPVGAQGIAQIMPATAKGWGVNPADPRQSLDAAARHMAEYVRKYGSYKNALVAYNAGPGRVGGSLPAETRNYIKKILGGSSPSAPRSPGALTTNRTPYVKVTPGQDNSSMRQSLLLNYLDNRHNPDALLGLATGLSQAQDTPSRYRVGEHVSRTREPSTTVQGNYGKPVNGLVPQVVKALAFARAHGWKGQVNSGYRSDAEQVRIWNSGVRPAAKPKALGGPGSNHSTGTAVDVSDVEGFARAMQKAPKGVRLYNNVPGDSLHFSVNGH